MTTEGTRVRSVLLALRQWEQPHDSLIHSLRVAKRRGATLEVLRVIQETQLPDAGLFLQSRLLAQRRRAIRADTLDWLRSELGQEALDVHVSVAQGELSQQAARRARARDVGLIVVSHSNRESGGLLSELARAAQRPVLAPRHWGHGRPILAATDLRDSRFPVLRHAAQLAKDLDRPLVAFHSAGPASPFRAPGARPDMQASRERFMDAARILPAETATVVRSEDDPVSAILQEAAALDAGMIAVGARHRSWWRRAFGGGGVACELSERYRFAMLVSPIPP
jgi:nucleotide-binding universal stress UspA family protein